MKILAIVLLTLATRADAMFSVYDDLFSSPKFVVRYDYDKDYTFTEADSLMSSPDNETYELIQSLQGPLLCHIPSLEPEPNEGDLTIDDDFKSRLNSLSVTISRSLEHKCFFHARGYWTYAFCHNIEVAQFNGDPKGYLEKKLHTYTLGRHDQKIDFPKLEARQEGGIVYLAHTMEDGSICDVTGKPRTVEIHYVCDPSASQDDTASLMWVKEYRTCQYQAQVSVPELCNEELLKQRSDPYEEVTCAKVVDSKLRDATRDGKKVFPDHRERINLIDYDLSYIENGFFVGKSKKEPNQPFIFIDSSPSDKVSTRIGESTMKWFPKKLMDDKAMAMELTRRLYFRVNGQIYDRLGNYIFSVSMDATKNEEGLPIMTFTFDRDMVVTQNVELLPVTEHVATVQELEHIQELLAEKLAELAGPEGDTKGDNTLEEHYEDAQGEMVHDEL